MQTLSLTRLREIAHAKVICISRELGEYKLTIEALGVREETNFGEEESITDVLDDTFLALHQKITSEIKGGQLQ